jgi:predicted negative regulator of RcsB-dependent stress response
MKVLNNIALFFISLIIAFVIFVAYRYYRLSSCQDAINQISYNVQFRKKQCDIIGFRKECYQASDRITNAELTELAEKGCLR